MLFSFLEVFLCKGSVIAVPYLNDMDHDWGSLVEQATPNVLWRGIITWVLKACDNEEVRAHFELVRGREGRQQPGRKALPTDSLGQVSGWACIHDGVHSAVVARGGLFNGTL